MEAAHIQAKSTKDRLDELKELQNGGYLTESEFKIARINILRDGGIDVVTQLQHARRPYLQQEEEPKGCGCGCFLATLLLTIIFVLGAAFFAAPYWPDSFGGVKARATREWFVSKSMEFIEKFFEDSEAEVPDPVSSVIQRPSVDSSDIAESGGSIEPAGADIVDDPVTLPPAGQSADQNGNIVLTSLDVHQPPEASSADITSIEPDMTVAETQEPVSAEPDTSTALSADQSVVESPVRGTVTYQNVRIRSTPDTSTNENVVGRGRSGDRFIVLEEGTGSDGLPWYNVVYENEDKRGWISGALVRLER